MEKLRYLKSYIEADLKKKMVFLAGPRQVGKTTLAKHILRETSRGIYLNWDNKTDRLKLQKNPDWPSDTSLVVIDELHKYRFWKRWIKGEFDKYREDFRFLITGSARMDVYRKGGDSLQGRYHHYRLHPLTLSELNHYRFQGKCFEPLTFDQDSGRSGIDSLLKFGGFPEPFLSQKEVDLRRWHSERLDRLIREDIRDLENIRDLTSLELLSDLLISKASQLLSLNSLREDIEVSHRAISHWVSILEQFYYIFRIYPFSGKSIRSLKKEAKVYLWDYSIIEDAGLKFENLVACHLLKFCHFLKDTQGYKSNLYYIRDVEKREVDFLVTINEKPWFAVESKLSDETVSPALLYFGQKLQIPHLYQIVLNGKKDFLSGKVRIIPASKFLSHLV